MRPTASRFARNSMPGDAFVVEDSVKDPDVEVVCDVVPLVGCSTFRVRATVALAPDAAVTLTLKGNDVPGVALAGTVTLTRAVEVALPAMLPESGSKATLYSAGRPVAESAKLVVVLWLAIVRLKMASSPACALAF